MNILQKIKDVATGQCGCFSRGAPRKTTSPPKEAGLYCYTPKGERQPDYCGITNNLERRYKQHSERPFANPDTHNYSYKTMKAECGRDNLEARETQKIHKYRPRSNIRKMPRDDKSSLKE